MRKFEYFEPKSLSEVFNILNTYRRDARILAGGTDLLVRLKRKEWSAKCIVNIKKIPELKYIHETNSELTIGPLVTIAQIASSPIVKKCYPILVETALKMASPQIRNIATVVGNICNSSPAADMALPLLCLDAKIRIQSAHSRREANIGDFFTAPGKSILEPNEVVTEIAIPMKMESYKGVFLKYEVRKAIDIAVVGVAIILRMNQKTIDDIRIALGAVAPTPIRATKAEAVLKKTSPDSALINKASVLASQEAIPIDDVRSSKDYRSEMIKVLVRRGLEKLLEK